MTTVYHYTTQQGANSIIQMESLRFTNIHFMNDTSEFKWFYNRAKEIHEQQYIPWVAEELIRREGMRKHLKSLKYEEGNKDDFVKASIFVSCLTSAKDSAPQWDRYAEKGKGICLGFDKEFLEAWIKNSKDLSDPPSVIADWINYDLNKTDELIKTSVENPSVLSILHKNESYKSEEEYRLGYFGVPYWQYEFLPTQDNLRCHITLKIPNFWSILKEVWIGPNASPEAYFAWSTLLNQKFRGNYFGHVDLKLSRSNLR